MEQYIPKSALVAEIKRQLAFYLKEIEDNKEDPWTMDIAKRDILQEFLSFINSLEVKEAELNKEFEWFLDKVEGVPRMWHSDEQIEWAKDIARHFFELALSLKNS